MTGVSFRPCIVIPTYDNPLTIAQVVHGAAHYVRDVIVVDDGSAEPGRGVINGLAASGAARVHRCERNLGKGAAVVTGFALARELGCTHAFQIDGDAQHDLGCIPKFLAASAAAPTALVAGYPVFDESVPNLRKSGRQIARFWVDVETGGAIITDPMTGFRVYPLDAAIACGPYGSGMEFDIEIAVRLVWAGVPVVNLPVGVRYLSREDGGVSHFRMVRDNVRITWLHTRLTTAALWRKVWGRA